jgi:hypothetical protein
MRAQLPLVDAAGLAAVQAQLKTGALFVPTDLGVAQFVPVELEIVTAEGAVFSLGCEVLQVMPGHGTALSIRASSKSVVDAVLAYDAATVGTSADNAEDAADAGDASSDDDGARSDQGASEGEQSSLAQQVAAMSVAEKRQAALHGGKEVRLLIARDHNKALHPFVLRNPTISLEEVEAMSRLTSLNPEALHLIAKEWTKNPTIVRNLVKNPKTPLPDAVALVEKLALSDVRAVAKGGSVRMAILIPARKRVNAGGAG